jgi:hypothetical protein
MVSGIVVQFFRRPFTPACEMQATQAVNDLPPDSPGSVATLHMQPRRKLIVPRYKVFVIKAQNLQTCAMRLNI